MHRARGALVMAALALSAAACSDGDDTGASGATTSPPPAAEAPAGSGWGTRAEGVCQTLLDDLQALSERVTGSPDPALGRETIAVLRTGVEELQALEPPARDGEQVKAALAAWHAYIDGQEAGIGQSGMREDTEEVLLGIEEAHAVLESQGAVTCATFLPTRAA